MESLVDMGYLGASRKLPDIGTDLTLDDVGGVVFVLDVAADLFHEVLEGYHSGGSAEFIDDYGYRPFFSHKAAHHLVGQQRLGREYDILELLLPVAVGRKEFTDMDISQDVVDILLIDKDFGASR